MGRRTALRRAATAAASAASPPFRIGQLAVATGLKPRTLRYYESVGLLRPAARTGSGYRLYGPDAVERLLLIRRARSLGLSLADIQDILRASDAGLMPCEHVVAAVHRQLESIAAQIRRLSSLRRGLLALRSRLDDAMASGAGQSGRPCPCLTEDGSLAADALIPPAALPLADSARRPYRERLTTALADIWGQSAAYERRGPRDG